MPQCTHTDQIHDVTPHTQGCEECLKMGDMWVHLRMCLFCGHVGCCDSSKKQARDEALQSDRSRDHAFRERGEDWGWCYIDEVEIDFE